MKEIKNSLFTWIIKQPIIFVFIGSLISLTSMFFSRIFNIQSPYFTPLFLFIFLIGAVYLVIKGLPKDEIDKKSFSIIFTVAKLMLILSVIALFVSIKNLAPFYIILFISFYLIGLSISYLYVSFKMAKKLGLDTWKIILSFPFGFMLLSLTGYFLADKKEKQILMLSNTFNSFINKLKKINLPTDNLFIAFVILNLSIINTLSNLFVYFIAYLYKILSKGKVVKKYVNIFANIIIIINILMSIVFVIKKDYFAEKIKQTEQTYIIGNIENQKNE